MRPPMEDGLGTTKVVVEMASVAAVTVLVVEVAEVVAVMAMAVVAEQDHRRTSTNRASVR